MKKNLFIFLLFISYNLSYGQWVQVGESIKQTKRGGSFAYTMAISGDGLTVVVGSKTSHEYAKYAGKVQVFRFENEKWEQIGDDIYGTKVNDEFGWAVDISFDGNIIAISARQAQILEGYVRVYTYSMNNWVQMGEELVGENLKDYFGYEISLNKNGNVVVISAIHNDNFGFNAGQVKTFEFKNKKWEQKGEGIIGKSVSINGGGDIIALNNGGTIKIYNYENNNWTQLGYDISDIGASTMDLSTDGLIIAIGTSSDKNYNYDGGRTSVYKFNGIKWEPLGLTFYNHSGRIARINGDGNIIATSGTAGIDEKGQSFYNPKVYSFFNGQWRDTGLSIDEEDNNNFIGTVTSISDDGFTVAIGGLSKISQFGYTEDVRIYTHSTRTFVKNEEEHQNIKIYPNPANEKLSVEVDGISQLNEYTIIDINGKTVYKSISPNSNLSIDLMQFSSGVYYLLVKNKTGISKEKLIVQ